MLHFSRRAASLLALAALTLAACQQKASAPAVTALARRHRVETPICDAVRAILTGELAVGPAIAALLARPLRAEA